MIPSAIRVVLADDHGVVRRGIRDFLTESDDIIVIAEAETGAQAFDYVIQHRPDVAVLDSQMPAHRVSVCQSHRRSPRSIWPGLPALPRFCREYRFARPSQCLLRRRTRR